MTRTRVARAASAPPVLTPALMRDWIENPDAIPQAWRPFWRDLQARHAAEVAPLAPDWVREPPEDDDDEHQADELNPLDAVSLALAMHQSADAELHRAVAVARARGCSWTALGVALGGISRQAVADRFGP